MTMQPLVPKPSIITAADSYDWAARVRSAIVRDGQAVRRGAANEIQAKCLRSDEWMPILLPGGGTSFATAEDRDKVIAMLWGEMEIPSGS